MAKMGNFDCSDLKKLQKQLEGLQSERTAIISACAKELAARLLAKVVKRTPVGVYPEETGKIGGTLRRGWTVGKIENINGIYKIEIINPVEYASFVEYGHRTANHKNWVEGKFMLTVSEQEIQNIAPSVLEKRLKQKLEASFK